MQTAILVVNTLMNGPDTDTVGLMVYAYDSSDTDTAGIVGNVLAEQTVEFSSNVNQDLLPSILGCIAQAGIEPSQLTGIVVIAGVDRFTIARLSAVITNSLGWSLQIPVCRLESEPEDTSVYAEVIAAAAPDAQIEAHYTKEPNIG